MDTLRTQVFSWDACLKYFQSAESVKETLTQFRTELIKSRRDLNRAFQQHHWDKVTFLLDYMLGAAGYCGVPRLYEQLKAAAPAGKSEVLSAVTLDRINHEIDEVLSVFAELAKKDWMPEER